MTHTERPILTDAPVTNYVGFCACARVCVRLSTLCHEGGTVELKSMARALRDT